MPLHAVFGAPPADLCAIPAKAVQLSPLVPGSRSLEELNEPLASATLLAPPGTIERRYALAMLLAALETGAGGIALAPKDKGGSRLQKELEGFGCEVEGDARRHHRICRFTRPAEPKGLAEAIAEGAPCFFEKLQLWTQPGIFSWDRLDTGSQLLLEHLPALKGRGADLGCGLGVLSRKVLEANAVKELHLLDLDGRAVAAAKKNITDGRARFHWADLRLPTALPKSLDFIVTNPPFHDGGEEDQALGHIFIRAAADLLRPDGLCWLVANRHLAYEEALGRHFTQVTKKAEAHGFKIYEAIR